MKRIPLILAVMLGCVSSAAYADGSGTMYNDGKAIALPYAYAYRTADRFNKGQQMTSVVFSDKAIDAAALADATDRGDALDDQLRGATRVELNIEADGNVQNLNIQMDGYSGSTSGSGWYTLDLKQNDDARIEGSFRSNDEEDKTSGRYYDLGFALDLPGAADLGAALPAGGGDAGKAYLAYSKALAKGDIDALAKIMTQSRADELLAHRNDADFKEMFSFIQGMALKNPKYVNGNSKGDTATLEYSGTDADGGAVTSVVTMQREGGAWKLAKESTKHGGS